MSLNLDAAIRLTANVSGVSGINQTKTALQQLAGGSQITNHQLLSLELTTKKFAAANNNSVAGIRNSISALRSLRDQHEINSKGFQRLTRDIEAYEKRLKAANQVSATPARSAFAGMGSNIAGGLATGGGLQSAIGGAGGALAAAGGGAGLAAAGAITAGAAVIGAGIGNERDIAAQGRAMSTQTDNAAELTVKIRELVREQGFMVSEAEAGAAAFEILSSNFTKTSDVLALIKSSSLGAVGGLSDIVTVADVVTGVLNGYRISAEYATTVTDMLVQTQKDGKIVISEYAASIGRLIPTAASAGIGLDEVNAGISSLTAQKIPVDAAISGVNQSILSIIRPTDKAREMAESLGIEFNATALATKGYGGVLDDVAKKTKGSTSALSILFSDIDGYKAVVGLINDKLQLYNQNLSNQRDLTGQSATAAKKALDPFKQFDNAWKSLSATIGREFLPSITGAITATTGLIQLLTSDQAKIAIRVAGAIVAPQTTAPLIVDWVRDRFTGKAPPASTPPTPQAQNLPASRVQAEDPGVAAKALEVLNGPPKEEKKDKDDETKALQRAAQDAAQQAKATADLERSMMEANARTRQSLDASTHQLAMEAVRRRYDYEQDLIRRNQDLWANAVVGEARTARAQLTGFLREIDSISSDTMGAAEQEQRAKARLDTARAGLRTAERSAAMERAAGQAYASAEMGSGKGTAAGGGGGNSKQQALRQAAQILGVSPVDLATIISYETIGTFSPSIVGGTGNRYQGLIQFGPSERRAYGANGSQSFEQQVMGPVIRYFQDRFSGVGRTTQGATLSDLYRTVNGGNPNASLSASDGNGTIGQHIERMSRDHRGRAIAFLGGASAADSTSSPPRPYMDTTGPGLVSSRGEVAAAELEFKAAQEAAKEATAQADKLRQIVRSGFLQQYGVEFREQADQIQASNEVMAVRNRLQLEGERPELIDAAVRQAEATQLYGSRVQGVTDALTLLDKAGRGSGAEAETLRQTLRNMGQDYEALRGSIDATARAQVAFNDAMRFQQDNRIGTGLQEGAQSYIESIGTMREATAQLAVQGIGGVENALVSLATTGSANFREFAAQMLESTARVIIQQLVLRTILQAVGAIGGGGGGGGFSGGYYNPMTGLGNAGPNYGFATGGIVNSPTLFRFARGGAMRTGLMGEAGPEAILPLRRGADGNLGVMATGGGGGTSNITINVDASGTSAQGDGGDGRELAMVVSRAVQAEMVRQQRPGGILNRRK